MVRARRSAIVQPPLARKAGGVQRGRHHRQAGHRHHQHLERCESVSRALPDPRRGGQARHLAGGRVSDGDARPHARRDVHEAEHDALSQPARDGRRGSAARVSRGRRRPDGRLRQDRAGSRHGRHEREPAGVAGAGRARCSAATGAVSSSDPEATSGSTGPSAGPARSTSAAGARWRTASPDPSARA